MFDNQSNNIEHIPKELIVKTVQELIVSRNEQYNKKPGPIEDHPDQLMTPIINEHGLWFNPQQLNNGYRRNKAVIGLRESITNLQAPNGSNIPVSDYYKNRSGRYEDRWLGDIMEEVWVSDGNTYWYDRNTILVFSRSGRDAYFPCSIVRKVHISDNDTTDRYYISSEEFDYAKYGYELVNNCWIDPNDEQARRIADERYLTTCDKIYNFFTYYINKVNKLFYN